jgi:hypothetical protein
VTQKQTEVREEHEEWTRQETILKAAAKERMGKVKRDIRLEMDQHVTVEKIRKYQSMLQLLSHKERGKRIHRKKIT